MFSTKRTTVTSAAKFIVLFREKGDGNVSYDTSRAFDTHISYNQPTAIIKRSSIHKRYYPPHFMHLPRIAASREKKRAMCGVLQ